ncbi:MAG: hypothetical protein D6725_02875 [Planctomycetota bacterium]|nr:MAG: hypothetical protein D6725_02875 [Planctomycetota bacterium]
MNGIRLSDRTLPAAAPFRGRLLCCAACVAAALLPQHPAAAQLAGPVPAAGQQTDAGNGHPERPSREPTAHRSPRSDADGSATGTVFETPPLAVVVRPARERPIRSTDSPARSAVVPTAAGGSGGSRPSAPRSPPSDDDSTASDTIVVRGLLLQRGEIVDGRGRRIRAAIVRGRAALEQGTRRLTASALVLWTDSTADGASVTAYAEGNARLELPNGTRADAALLHEFHTRGDIRFDVRSRVDSPRLAEDPLYRRAARYRTTASRRHGLPEAAAVRSTGFHVAQPQPAGVPLRTIRIFPRHLGAPYNVVSWESKDSVPPEQVIVITGGVNLVVSGIETLGTLDLTADRAVIWSRSLSAEELAGGTTQTRDTPLQVYLEGAIVVRQGENVLRATRAFFDAREYRGVLTDAELRIPLHDLGLNLRVRAERIRQIARYDFHASNAWVSTSPFGKPGYRIQATDVFVEDRGSLAASGYPGPLVIPGAAGSPQIADTGARLASDGPRPDLWVTALNNVLYWQDLPLLYVPVLTGPLEDPGVPIRRVTFDQDRIFGTQIRTAFDALRLLGWEAPPGTEGTFLLDYLSERGVAAGATLQYDGYDVWNTGESYSGRLMGYYVNDGGTDNLGFDRRALIPPSPHRGRFLLRHRQSLPWNMRFLAEIGYLSDRNFLEQYFENEFDEGKDNETVFSLSQDWDGWSWRVLARPQVNEFETTTEWLPRGDLYNLGLPLLDGLLNWSSHTSVAYARLRPATPPTDPNDTFSPLPFVTRAEGLAYSTRHEITLPVQAGPTKLVPYVWGEFAQWNDGFTGDEIDRASLAAGIRGSLQMWRAFPYVQSHVWGLDGLAHKMVFDFDYSALDTNEPLANIPQYNEFDDNAQERFRYRLLTNTFGGVLPATVEPRFYAVRTGAGRGVTAPYHELIARQQVLRLGWRHRLQTRVGPAEDSHIVDWMTLDLEAAWFPEADRDNFGEPFGLFRGDYRWNLGQRTSFLASGQFDIFDNAPRIWSVGLLNQRPTRGSVYVGFRSLQAGALDSQILTASLSYATTPKWVFTAGTAYDLKENRNAGQSLTITRVGADFLVHLGATYDAAKNNAGIAVMVEPRIGPPTLGSPQLGSLLGIR